MVVEFSVNFLSFISQFIKFTNSVHSEDIWRITLGVICGIVVLQLFLYSREKTAGVKAIRKSKKTTEVKVRSHKVKVNINSQSQQQ